MECKTTITWIKWIKEDMECKIAWTRDNMDNKIWIRWIRVLMECKITWTNRECNKTWTKWIKEDMDSNKLTKEDMVRIINKEWEEIIWIINLKWVVITNNNNNILTKWIRWEDSNNLVNKIWDMDNSSCSNNNNNNLTSTKWINNNKSITLLQIINNNNNRRSLLIFLMI